MFISGTLLLFVLAVHAFDPRSYTLDVASCLTVKRVNGIQEPVNIDIHYANRNPKAKRSLLLVHGWPGGWATWSNQIERFENDYNLIVPELRGFGASGHPGGIGTTQDVVDDLRCIMQHANVGSAVCVGHDWGSAVCWEAARSRPDVFTGVIGLAIPYIPSAGPFMPIAHLAKNGYPRLSYQLFFDHHTKEAARELDVDKRRSLRTVYLAIDTFRPTDFLTSTDSFMAAWDDVSEIKPIPLLSQDEEDYLVERYELSGFEYTLQFYSTKFRHASWEFTHNQGNHTIPQPTLSILPLNDSVGDWVAATKMLGSEMFLPKLTIKTVEAAHWPQLEKPTEVNEIMREWLDSVGEVVFPMRGHDEL